MGELCLFVHVKIKASSYGEIPPIRGAKRLGVLWNPDSIRQRDWLMLHIPRSKSQFGASDTPQTAAFNIDLDGVVVSLSEDAARLLTACSDVLSIDGDNRVILSSTDAPLRVGTGGCEKDATERAPTVVPLSPDGSRTVHIIPRQGLGATIVLFMPECKEPPRHPALSRREHEILLLSAKGLRRDRMAHHLGISIATVDLHCANLRRKLGAKTTSEAVAKGLGGLTAI
jgi:DNA-binding CsgD family transcriptional regulator